MTQPRKTQVSIQDTPYYHIVSRCVRRTFLCGIDRDTGQSFEHRRQWIEDRIRLLSSLFSVDICAYAVMSNHFHLVLKLCEDESFSWSMEEVLARWTSLYKGPSIVQKWRDGELLSEGETKALDALVEQYRKRLSDLSWFMKCLNEPIARQANREDDCTGHFWESRFKSQALLTDEALLSCMAYVDLNPVRAGMAETPETSNHTSIKERIQPQFDTDTAIKNQCDEQVLRSLNVPLKPLAKFEGDETLTYQIGIPFALKDYLELVDETGRIIRQDKQGAIAEHLPPILKRLNLDGDNWLKQCRQFEKVYRTQFSKRCLGKLCNAA